MFRLLRQAEVAFGMAAILCLFMGQFALFTYLRPFLEQVTGGDVATLSLVLLAMGVTGLIGTGLIGALLRRSVRRVLVVIPVLMSGIAIALATAVGSLVATGLLLRRGDCSAHLRPWVGAHGSPGSCRTIRRLAAA